MNLSSRPERWAKPLLLTLALTAVSLTLSFAQSRTVTRFMEDHSPSQKFFFYPSTLRMVNIEKNPDFYAVVHDVEKLRVLMYEKGSSGFTSQTFRELSQDMERENYQELMTLQTPEQKAYLYSRGEDETPEGVVGIVETEDAVILTDLEGFVNLPSLLNLFQSDFNFEDIAGLVNIASQMRKEIEEETH